MPFDYQIKPSKRRKSVSIIIQKGQVRVLVPSWFPKIEIEKLMVEKQAWILAKIAEQEEEISKRPDPKISNDAELYLFGQRLKVAISLSGKKSVFVDPTNLSVQLILSARTRPENHQAHFRALLQDAYSQRLSAYLETRLPELANLMKLNYHSFKVKNYKAKWGACNSRKELSFNWRLACMPVELIDSVIIHELAHLKHLDHSRAFWQLVGQFDAKFKQHKQALADWSKQIIL
ncbi:M48 family metallopeptidase [Catenovulum sp. SM1970]|uniref:M48 family metallopeptidase n=1 Tax=Marinifaba aquimaris TaxID=2741323 RepID=UPI0015736DA8|nr:SprT family zinc-dependent metalloprotease [Marinifaba aquimaris]NTS76745.1 M48 family metallopeptidase [Marinifaba aquimaris]